MKGRFLALLILALAICAQGSAQRGDVFQIRLILEDRPRARKVGVTIVCPKSAEPLPWVVFSPGFLFRGEDYLSWGEGLSSAGMAVALVSYAYSLFSPDHRAWAADLLFLLDSLPKEAGRYGITLDPERVALVGHSLGGKLSFLAAAEHPVRAVVGLDPVDAAPESSDPVRFPSAIPLLGAIKVPALLLGAEYGERVRFGMPCAPPEANFRKFFAALPGPAWEITQLGSGHLDYLDNPHCGLLCVLCWPGDVPQNTRKNAQIYVLLFLRAHLLGIDSAQIELLNLLSRHEKEGLVLVQKKPEDIEPEH